MHYTNIEESTWRFHPSWWWSSLNRAVQTRPHRSWAYHSSFRRCRLNMTARDPIPLPFNRMVPWDYEYLLYYIILYDTLTNHGSHRSCPHHRVHILAHRITVRPPGPIWECPHLRANNVAGSTGMTGREPRFKGVCNSCAPYTTQPPRVAFISTHRTQMKTHITHRTTTTRLCGDAASTDPPRILCTRTRRPGPWFPQWHVPVGSYP